MSDMFMLPERRLPSSSFVPAALVVPPDPFFLPMALPGSSLLELSRALNRD